MSVTVGIDLGTSNCVVGLKKLRVEILPNKAGEDLTPSFIYFDPQAENLLDISQTTVGTAAKKWQKQAPQNSISAIKRLMGRGINDPAVQKLIQENRMGYDIGALSLGSANSIAVFIPKSDQQIQELTPEEISSLLIKQLLNDSEALLGDKIDTAVITVPAYFNDKQKHATRVAAIKAGVKMPHLLPEPTSAAISFGIDELKGESSQSVLVYDFGGGTLDISILTLGGNNIIEQGKGGDMWLGGNDVDHQLVGLILKKASQAAGADLSQLIDSLPLVAQKKLQLELTTQAEKAKIELTENQEAYVTLLGQLTDPKGNPIDIDITIQRAEFDQMIKPLIMKSIEIMNTIMTGIDFSPELIDKVLLVGGSSQIPLVKSELTKIFGAGKVMLHPRPTLAIAEGAAIFAHRLELPDHETAQNTDTLGSILHTSSHDYYLKLANGDYHLMVPKFSPLPCTAEIAINLESQNQALIHFQFFNQVDNQFESIGDLWTTSKYCELDHVNKEIQLQFTISEENLIEIATLNPQTAASPRKQRLSRGHINEQLYLSLEQSLNKVNALEDKFLSMDYEHRVEHIIPQIMLVMNKQDENIDQSALKTVQGMQQLADAVIEHEEPLFPNLWHYESLYDNFNDLVDPAEVKQYKTLIKEFRQKNLAANTTIDEIIALRDHLNDRSAQTFHNMEDLHFLYSTFTLAKEKNLKSADKLHFYLEKLHMHQLSDSEKTESMDRAMETAMQIQDDLNAIKHTIYTGVNLSSTL